MNCKRYRCRSSKEISFFVPQKEKKRRLSSVFGDGRGKRCKVRFFYGLILKEKSKAQQKDKPSKMNAPCGQDINNGGEEGAERERERERESSGLRVVKK